MAAKNEGQDPKYLPPSLDVQVPEVIHIVKVYAKRGQKFSAEDIAELLERALDLDETSLFAKGDTVCITFVRQGGPITTGPGPK
jgi:hypothetical protein